MSERPSAAEVAEATTLLSGGPSRMLKCPRCQGMYSSLWTEESCVDCAIADPPPREKVMADIDAPRRLYNFPFNPDRTPDIAAALDRLVGWRRYPGDSWSVTLIGPTGTGKSALAVELYWRWYQGHFRRSTPIEVPTYGAFVRARQIVDAALSRREEGAEERLVDIARWRRLPVLIVDEYGVGHAPGGATDPIVDLCARRYDRDLATVFTTNLPSVAALEALSPQLADRMRAGLILPVKGDSLRGGTAR